MNLIFFKFLFKFHQVEIEMLIMGGDSNGSIPTTKKVIKMLKRFNTRVILTFFSFLLLTVIFVVTYLVCELQEERIKGQPNSFTLYTKTTQIVL